MSKKSRRRNRRILGALGALGLGLALANRGKGTEMSNISVESGRGSGLRPTVDDMPKKKKTVYQDPIMTGGKGVKQGFKTTSANVQKNLIDPPGLLSQGEIKFEKPISIIPKKKFKSSAEVQRERLFNKAANAQRAQTFDQEGFKSPMEIFQDSMLGDTSIGGGISAKKGGRIVKGKKTAVRTGAAKRGFGRAYTKRRK
jgi:hypothetical protein